MINVDISSNFNFINGILMLSDIPCVFSARIQLREQAKAKKKETAACKASGEDMKKTFGEAQQTWDTYGIYGLMASQKLIPPIFNIIEYILILLKSVVPPWNFDPSPFPPWT